MGRTHYQQPDARTTNSRWCAADRHLQVVHRPDIHIIRAADSGLGYDAVVQARPDGTGYDVLKAL